MILQEEGTSGWGYIFMFLLFGYLLYICCIKTIIRNVTYRPEQQKWKKYIRTIDPNVEKKIFEKIKNFSDEDFKSYLWSMKKKINYKYRTGKKGLKNTILKRSMLNVINKRTQELPFERIKQIEGVFPLLRRVYFGPGLNNEVYNKKQLKKKFHFKLKTDHKVPQLNSIIDLAQYFNVIVNVLLRYSFNQKKRSRSYYIKRNNIFNQFGYTKIPDDYSYIRNKKVSDEDIANKEEKKSKNLSELETPSFLELKSPFYTHTFIEFPNKKRRLISSPTYWLKQIQLKILHEILEKVEIPDYCTGFVPGKSTVDNASIHLRANTLIKLDLLNFFPSLKFWHVLHVFRGIGYNRPVSGVLACLCTDWYHSKRFIPQGAPTSPMIANLYASKMDIRLNGLSNKFGLKYSRYADDLSFSSINEKIHVRKFIASVYHIIRDEKLYPNFSKTKVFRKGNRKAVTGIIVNEKLNVDRKWLNSLRGELYRYQKFGLPHGEEGDTIYNQLQGKIAYLHMVNPEKAKKYTHIFQKLKELK
ncbi:MAG: reverse transcriptase family protein [Promethearchaeota archaeon]